MWKRCENGLALAALLTVGCGGESVNLGHNGGSQWTDVATSTGAATKPQTIYETGDPILGFTLDGPTLYALLGHEQSIEVITCPLTRCRSERTTVCSRPKAANEAFSGSTPLVRAAGLLYWAETPTSQGRVMACPTTGSSGPQVVATEWSRGLAADDDGAYWLDPENRLMRGAHDAEAPTPVRDLSQQGQLGRGLTAHGDHIYFVASDYDSSSVRRVRKDGTGDPEPVAVDRIISGLSFASDSLYYLTQVLTGRVAKCPLGGCATEGSTLAADQRWPSAIRVEGNEVFWLNHTEWSLVDSTAVLMSCQLPNCATLQTRLVEMSFALSEIEDESFAINQESIVWLEGVYDGARLLTVAR